MASAKVFFLHSFLIRPGRHNILHNDNKHKGILSEIQHNGTQDNVVILNIVMLSGVMLNVVMLSVVILNIVMLNVVMLSVVAPFSYIILVSFLKSAQNVPTHIFFLFLIFFFLFI